MYEALLRQTGNPSGYALHIASFSRNPTTNVPPAQTDKRIHARITAAPSPAVPDCPEVKSSRQSRFALESCERDGYTYPVRLETSWYGSGVDVLVDWYTSSGVKR